MVHLQHNILSACRDRWKWVIVGSNCLISTCWPRKSSCASYDSILGMKRVMSSRRLQDRSVALAWATGWSRTIQVDTAFQFNDGINPYNHNIFWLRINWYLYTISSTSIFDTKCAIDAMYHSIKGDGDSNVYEMWCCKCLFWFSSFETNMTLQMLLPHILDIATSLSHNELT